MSDQTEQSQAAMLLETQPELREEAAASSLFDLLQRTAKRVTVDGEELFVVEGDLTLDEDQLMVYAINQEKRQTEQILGIIPGGLGVGITNIQPDPQSASLVGIITQGGKIVRWREGVTLTYCVLRGTFSSQEQYALVRANMQKATEDWQRVCGVQFEHRADL